MSFQLSAHANTTPEAVAPLPCLPPPHTPFQLVLLRRIGPAVPSLRYAPIEGIMNGFSDHGLDEDSFGASKGGIASFDAFRKYCVLSLQWLAFLGA